MFGYTSKETSVAKWRAVSRGLYIRKGSGGFFSAWLGPGAFLPGQGASGVGKERPPGSAFRCLFLFSRASGFRLPPRRRKALLPPQVALCGHAGPAGRRLWRRMRFSGLRGRSLRPPALLASLVPSRKRRKGRPSSRMRAARRSPARQRRLRWVARLLFLSPPPAPVAARRSPPSRAAPPAGRRRRGRSPLWRGGAPFPPLPSPRWGTKAGLSLRGGSPLEGGGGGERPRGPAPSGRRGPLG